MSFSAYRLKEVQRWMQSVITHPGGVEAGAADEESLRLNEVHAKEIESIILPGTRLTSQQRIEIYHQAYYARLLDCLRGFFPVLAHAIGQEAFEDFAFGYLQKYPSRSYTLNRLSDCFIQFLEETKPFDAGDELDWPDFLIDLARLEWTIDAVFDGPGNERQRPLSIFDLQAIPSDLWPAVQLIMNPSLQLLEFRFPVNDYYSAYRRDDASEFPAAKRSLVAIHRREFIVRRKEVTYEQFQLLRAIAAGQTLGEAIASVVEDENADGAVWQAELAGWFESWTADQFFAAIVVNTKS